MGANRERGSSRVWVVVAVLLGTIAVALLWLRGHGVRLPHRGRSTVSVTRPAGVPPPFEAQPIAIWPTTTKPLTNLHGDLRLGYEKLPSVRSDTLTVKVTVELLDPNGAFQPMLRLHFARPMPGQSGQVALGALLGAFAEQQPVNPPLNGQGQLVISVGEREEKGEFRRLSNQVVVPCGFEAGKKGRGGP